MSILYRPGPQATKHKITASHSWRRSGRARGGNAALTTRAKPRRDNNPSPQTPGIDNDDAARRLDHDRRFFMDLLERFVHAHQGGGERVRAWIANGSGDDALAYLHRLRGQAGTIAATHVMRTSAALENALRSSMPVNESLLDAFESSLGEVIEGALGRVENPATDGVIDTPRELDVATFISQLESLQKAVENHDLSCLDQDTALLQMAQDTFVSEAYSRISDAVLELKFKPASEAIGRLLDTLRSAQRADEAPDT